jgi:hypothetical protein
MRVVLVAPLALVMLAIYGCGGVTYPRPVSTHGSCRVVTTGIATDEEAELRSVWVNGRLVSASTVDDDSIDVTFRSDTLGIVSRVRVPVGPDETWMLSRSGQAVGIVSYRSMGDSALFRVRMIDVDRGTVEPEGPTVVVPNEIEQITWTTFSESAGAHSMLRFESREGEIGDVDTDTTVYALMSLPDLRLSGPHTMAVNEPSRLPEVYHGENDAFTLVYLLRDSLCEERTKEKTRYVEGGIERNGVWSPFQFSIDRRLDRKNFRTELVVTTSGDQPVIWAIDICDSGIVSLARYDRDGSGFRRGWSYDLRERESFVHEELNWNRARPVGARVYEDGVMLVFEERHTIYTASNLPSMTFYMPPVPMAMPSIPRVRFSDGRIQTTSLDSWGGLFESDGLAFFYIDLAGKVRWRTIIDRGGTTELKSQTLGHSYADGLVSIGPALGNRVPMAWRDMDKDRIVTASIDLTNGVISPVTGAVLIDEEAYWYARQWSPDGVLRSLTTMEDRETVPLIIDMSR